MDRRDRYERVIALLDEWFADESGFDERVWPEVEAALPRRFEDFTPEQHRNSSGASTTCSAR